MFYNHSLQVSGYIIYSTKPEKHLDHLSQVFETLRHHRLFVNLAKWSFFIDILVFLSYITYVEDIKVERIQN